MNLDREPAPKAGARRGWRAVALVGAFVAGALTFSGVSLAAEQMGMANGHSESQMQMHAMMGEHLDRALAAVDATADQKARIHEILHGAMQSMGSSHDGMAGFHDQLHQLLFAPVIDRAALEKLRAEHVASIDQASRAFVNAMADAAEVLTPEQRSKLGQMMTQEHRR